MRDDHLAGCSDVAENPPKAKKKANNKAVAGNPPLCGEPRKKPKQSGARQRSDGDVRAARRADEGAAERRLAAVIVPTDRQKEKGHAANVATKR